MASLWHVDEIKGVRSFNKLRRQLPVRVSHHVLHADADLSITVKSSVEAHDVGRVALMQHLQLSDDLVSDGGLDFQVN